MPIGKRSAAEFIGTFWLVLGGCGAAVLSAAFPGLGIGFVGVALAFGLTVLTMAFAIGHISGCPLESRNIRRTCRRQEVSVVGPRAIHHRPSGGGNLRSVCAVCDRPRQERL